MTRRAGRRRIDVPAAVLVVLGSVVAGCGGTGPSDDVSPTTAPPFGDVGGGSLESSPFTVGAAPEGFELVVAGRDPDHPGGSWGDDLGGTDEPYTVLSPDGTAAHPEAVVVSATGYEGYQGGIDQASSAYPGDGDERFEIDGRFAIYVASGSTSARERRSELVVDSDRRDLAIRVATRSATREELVEIAEATVPPGSRTEAPTVPEPPAGLRLVGSVDVQGVLALDAAWFRPGDTPPGPASAHGAGWRHGELHLAVMTVPGRSIDLAALAGPAGWRGWSTRIEQRPVGARPGLVVDHDHGGRPNRTVLRATEWGDVVVVNVHPEGAEAPAPGLPADDELVALAESVAPTDPVTWEQFVVDAAGGPGVRPDLGRTELARGRHGDVEWILQGGPVGGPWGAVDPCLKLSTRERVCANLTEWRNPSGSFAYGPAEGDRHGLPPFQLVTTTTDAHAVRITGGGTVATADLTPLGDGWRAGVVFTPAEGWAVTDDGAPASGPTLRIELLDADGRVVGRLGMGG